MIAPIQHQTVLPHLSKREELSNVWWINPMKKQRIEIQQINKISQQSKSKIYVKM